jgi:hypothetical protein
MCWELAGAVAEVCALRDSLGIGPRSCGSLREGGTAPFPAAVVDRGQGKRAWLRSGDERRSGSRTLHPTPSGQGGTWARHNRGRVRGARGCRSLQLGHRSYRRHQGLHHGQPPLGDADRPVGGRKPDPRPYEPAVHRRAGLVEQAWHSLASAKRFRPTRQDPIMPPTRRCDPHDDQPGSHRSGTQSGSFSASQVAGAHDAIWRRLLRILSPSRRACGSGGGGGLESA